MSSFDQFAEKNKLSGIFSRHVQIQNITVMGSSRQMEEPITEMETIVGMKAKLFKNVLNGGYLAHGDINLANQGAASIPDMSEVKLDGTLDISGNKLPNLYGVPREFTKVISDFGTFNSPNEIPADLKKPTGEQLAKKASEEARVTAAAERQQKNSVWGRLSEKLKF